ncbi:L-cystine transport system permease protein TcyB [Propionicimonas sp. T2.31MG-18]|uniref:amino acid ABC transporter permease n=1 Tax=Propionicimonas sp. T2.31MG-18 TaxID=3157620 RepID=UPI0035EE4DCD
MGQGDWELLLHSIVPMLLGTVTGTIPLAVISFAIGLVIALLVALARLSSVPVLARLAQFYVSVIRGTPLLVQLYLIVYALPSLGVVIDPFPSAVVAFSLNVGGYAAETIRAAILAVPRGQWEAASTVGMGYSLTLRRVVLPQALRVAVPPLSNTFISLVKDTSLASSVMVTELLRKAQEIAAPSFAFLQLYTLAALIYWLVCTVLSVAQQRLERRLGRYTTV